jgi:hypothetical protein
MSFLEKYLIVSKLGEGETMSFRAQDTSTGQAVLLHQLLPGRTPPHQPDLAPMVFKYLPGAGAPGTEHFLQMGLEEDRVFIVTADVPECLDLRKWLQSVAASQGDRGTFARPSQSEPGSTQRFPGLSPDNLQEGLPSTSGTLILSSPQPAWTQPAAPDPGKTQVIVGTPLSQRPPEPPESKHEPGEFTRMFSAPGSKTKPPGSSVSKDDVSLRPPPPSVPPASQEAAKKSPGEFTMMFFGKDIAGQKAAPPAPPPSPELKPGPAVKPPDKHPRGQVPSGFEVVYQSRKQPPRAGSPLEPPRPTNVPPPQGPAETAGSGEFTQKFSGISRGKVEPPPARAPHASSPQPPAEKAGPGEFTQLFRAPMARTEPPAAPPPSPGVSKPSAPPPASPAQKGPGEFTLIFRASAQAPSKTEPPLSGPSQGPTMPPAGSGSRGLAQEPPAFPASQSDSRGPGEFTQLFKSGGDPMGGTRAPGIGSPSQPPAPLPGASKKGPGELSRMMQGYKPPTATPAAPVLEPPKPSSPPPAAEPGKRGPGEFTMLFRRPPQPAAPVPPVAAPPPTVQPAPPPPQPRQPGEYTSIFEAPRLPPTPPQAVPQAAPPAGYGYPAVPGAPPPPPAMPQMPAYQVPPPPAAPQVAYPQVAMPQPPQFQPPPPPAYAMAPPPAPQAMPAGTKKPGKFLVPLLILGGLFLVAVALILYFALKH